MDLSDVAEDVRTPWWVRVRSGLSLLALLAVLGVAIAAAIGVFVVVVGTLLDQALG